MPVNETGTYWDPVSICNAALGMLGDVGKARRMRNMTRGANTLPIHEVAIDFYFAAKEQMHAMMDWKRTRKVKELTLKVDDDGENEAPVLSGKWTYKYVRPPDCLIFRKVLDTDGTEWEYDLVVEESVKSTNTREAGYGEYYNDEYIYCNVADAIGWYTILIGEERYVPGMGQLHAMILAQLESVEPVNGGGRPAQSATAVAEGVTFFIPLAGVIDFAKERERLAKDLAKAEGDIEKCAAKLKNMSAAANAPAEKVAEAKEQHDAALARRDRLKETIAVLS